jgi:hypothetical protein
MLNSVKFPPNIVELSVNSISIDLLIFEAKGGMANQSPKGLPHDLGRI